MRFQQLLTISLLICLRAPTVFPQATGSILGTISDSSSAVLVGAKVTATNVNTNVSREVLTNSTGYYQLDNLIPGEYTVTAEMQGFKKAVRPRFELQVAQSAPVSYTHLTLPTILRV